MRAALRNQSQILDKMGEPILSEILDAMKQWQKSGAEEPKQGDRLTMGRFELEVTRVVYDVVSLALKKVIK